MPKLLEENTLIFRSYIGEAEHPVNGEKIDICTTTSTVPCIEYKGRTVTWSWQELIEEAIKMIDEDEVQNEMRII